MFAECSLHLLTLRIKGQQFDVPFYLNCTTMYKPRKLYPKGPYMSYVYPGCTHSLCVSAGSEGIFHSNPSHAQRQLSCFCCKNNSFGCNLFLWAKGWEPESRSKGYGNAGQEDMGKQCSGSCLLAHKASAVAQLLQGAPALSLLLLPSLQETCQGDTIWDVKIPSSTYLLASTFLFVLFAENFGLKRMGNTSDHIGRLRNTLYGPKHQRSCREKFLKSVLKAMLCSRSLGKTAHALVSLYSNLQE